MSSPVRAVGAVLVDFGGVLACTVDAAAHRGWERRLGLRPGGLRAALFDHPAAWRATAGAIGAEAAFAAIARRHRLSATELAALWEDFWRAEGINQALLDRLACHRGRLPMAVVSNFWSNGRDIIVDRFGLDRHFAEIFISAEERLKKPSRRLLDRVAARLGCRRPDMLLVDDSWLNVAHARLVGCYGLRFRDNARSLPELDALLADGR